ncbi:UDP-glycosyltransferase 72B1 [Hordeum vulgare]|nr:UDP-glycosyltransferase 72B1 [Hordeum vulgare]
MLVTPGMGHLIPLAELAKSLAALITFASTTQHYFITFILHLPELDVSLPDEFRDLAEPVRLPSCVPIEWPDVMSAVQDKSDACYRWMVHHAKRYHKPEAILINSFDAVEPDAVRVLSHLEPGCPPVYNIGPLIRANASDEPAVSPPAVGLVSHLRLLWFRRLADDGAYALGLELSRQRFLWVVRSLSDEGPVSTSTTLHDDPQEGHPGRPPGGVRQEDQRRRQ